MTLFDHSCFVKYRRRRARCAARVLNRICANEIDVPVGRVVYTQWLNELGGIEADVTVTRLSETSFLVVTIAVSQRRDLAWLTRHIPEGAHVLRPRHHLGPADAGADGAEVARAACSAVAR